MGVVYEATQLSLGRSVALKVLSPDVSSDESFRERFRREARIQAGLDHPHIVPVYAAGELDGEGLFLAMRVVRGPTLKQLVRSAKVSPARAIRILAPVADALDVAHEADLVHRDVKPQNILIARRDHPYLADFGLTRAPGDTAFTKTGHFVGTLDYIAPEQIAGQPLTSAGDVYSLAAVAFECLTGIVPFPKPTEAAILYAHMSEPPPRASDVRDGIGAEMDRVLQRGLAKVPSDRHASATEFIQELEEALVRDEALVAPPPRPVVAPEEHGASTEPTPVKGSDDAPRFRPAHPTVSALAPTPPAPPAPFPTSAHSTSVETVPPAVEDAGDDDRGDTIDVPRAGVPTRADRRRDVEAAGTGAVAARRLDRDSAAPQQPDAARDGQPMRGAGLRRLAMAGAAVVVLAAVAGVLTASDAPPPGSERLTSGPVRLTVPEGWRRTAARATAGLELSSPATAVAPRAERASITLGTTDATGAHLLPEKFLDRLAEPPPRGERVSLGGGVEALRYDNLRPQSSSTTLTVLAAPTTDGIATVVCEGPAAARRACEGASATLRLSGDVKALPAGPREEYAQAITSLVQRLERRRDSALNAWRKAKTRRGQGSAAAAMADAFKDAARRLRKVRPTPLEAEAHAALGMALTSAEQRYRAAATAARSNQAGRYEEARRAGVRAERAVRRALLDVRKLGYKVS